MTLHFQDEVATNLLTIDAVDPKSGTAEFKATAIRIEKVPGEARDQAGHEERADAAGGAAEHDAAGGAAGHTPAAAREP
jgi:formate dehydrogenase major subunit